MATREDEQAAPPDRGIPYAFLMDVPIHRELIYYYYSCYPTMYRAVYQ